MASRVEVSNMALSKLGEDDQLLDPKDNSKPARSIAAVWDAVRDAVLRKHFWNFAMTRASLSALSTAPAWGYRYQFPLPPDFLRLDISTIEPQSVRSHYSLEGKRMILCDHLGPLKIRYVRKVAEVGDWDALFVEAFACKLAAQICIRLTGSKTLKKDLLQEYRLALAEAKGADGRENLPEAPLDTGWVTSRYDGGYQGSANGYATRFE